MAEDLAEIIRALPEEAFREPSAPLLGLSYLERLRWLQQTAYFIWKYKGAAWPSPSPPPRSQGSSG